MAFYHQAEAPIFLALIVVGVFCGRSAKQSASIGAKNGHPRVLNIIEGGPKISSVRTTCTIDSETFRDEHIEKKSPNTDALRSCFQLGRW